MSSKDYHIAQVNVARMLAALEDPVMASFVARLEEINRLADHSPGFVWRLQSEEGNATYLRPYEDEKILFNMSVWESVESLKRYVFETAHAEVMRNRRAWFEKMEPPYSALWWIRAGHIPTVSEAKLRLEELRQNGPSSHVFTFTELYDPSDLG